MYASCLWPARSFANCNPLACAAALAVLEVLEEEKLMGNATLVGKYLRDELEAIPELKNVRGRGLMIGFDVPEELKDLKKNLLWNQKIFTGEAKPNVIRLLPALNITKLEADIFLEALAKELKAEGLKPKANAYL